MDNSILSGLISTYTPPPSDHEDSGQAAATTTMLTVDQFYAQPFYPSPSPSYTSHQSCYTAAPSPVDMHTDILSDQQEESRRSLLLTASGPMVMAQGSVVSPEMSHFSAPVQYPMYADSTWLPYNTYSALPPPPATDVAAAYHYPVSNATPDSFTPYGNTASTTTFIPPAPQTITTATFNFADPIKPEQTSQWTTQSIQHFGQSPNSCSRTSLSEVSSRPSSPGLATASVTTDGQYSRRQSVLSRKTSNSSLQAYGIAICAPGSSDVQAWKCSYPNCTSRAVFTRGCDLRKHYNRHSKHLFCRVDGCPQSEAACIAAAQRDGQAARATNVDTSNLSVAGGFSSKKDRARHEAKHNPGIKCEWHGPDGERCGRLFSRMDNMKDHVRRIHNKGQAEASKPRAALRNPGAL